MRARPLSPLGALAAHDEGWREQLRDQLGDAPYIVARELARCVAGGPASDAVLALAAACLAAAERGSTRVPIGTAGAGVLADTLAALHVPPAIATRAFALLTMPAAERGAAGSMLGGPGEFKPLLVDGEALCAQRMMAQEADLGARLRARLAQTLAPFDAGRVGAALADVIARSPVVSGTAIALSTEQQRAIVAAAHQPLTVISGGPGTGKTSIVVSLLRLLLRLGVPVESIALAAPTGKAANRMEEAVVAYLKGIPDRAPDDETLLARRPAPTTLHRLLGFSPSRDRFTHHARNPLTQAVVIVDEASMIDLALMSQLVRAVGPLARLVLLGDAEQLPSVDAGAVLRDLVPSTLRPPARPWDALVGAPADVVTLSGDLRAHGAVRLTHSYRMNEADPAGRSIFLVSREVREGRVPPVVAAPHAAAHLVARASAAAVNFAGVELLDGPASEQDAFLDRWFTERVAPSAEVLRAIQRTWPLDGRAFAAGEHTALAGLDRQFQRARVLCLTRRTTGRINTLFAARLRELAEGDPPGRDRFLAGTPVLMTQNDYQLGLFNGDQGIVLWVQRAGEPAPRLRYVFRIKGAFEVHEPGALGAQVEPCWAMTVHKAQGSEFDHVTLVLPAEAELAKGGDAATLACREVVYTAMTRAKKSVTVIGTHAALQAAVERSLQRWSALSDPAYWGT